MATSTTAKTKSKKAAVTKTPAKSRAAKRLVEPGNWAYCVLCEEPIKFRARERRVQVICNVYVNKVWNRVEHFHDECYEKAANPYGEPAAMKPLRGNGAKKAAAAKKNAAAAKNN